ncbi:ankyrin repeat and fibronectin type III domain containing protein wide awake isoform X3 [Rhodnius prolixus]|uniref:ankyrin repeat and fibronectin type III domain containing protein wide awake isoform X3 n=1 Tax=Rhodnius prolixus TaxID=13249 RepID=UPI003D187F13
MAKMNRSTDKLLSPGSPENFRKLQRRSSFRASLRRMGTRLTGGGVQHHHHGHHHHHYHQTWPWQTADHHEKRPAPFCSQQVYSRPASTLTTPTAVVTTETTRLASSISSTQVDEQPRATSSTQLLYQTTNNNRTTAGNNNSAGKSQTFLPVVSFYSTRQYKENVEMRFVRRKPSIRGEEHNVQHSLRRIARDNRLDVLSPNSRMRVDRLVRKFGPEVLQTSAVFNKPPTNQNQQQSAVKIKCNSDEVKDFRRNYKIPSPKYQVPQTEPMKRRSFGHIMDEGRRPKSTVENNGAMEVGRLDRNKKLPPIDIHLTALFAAVEHGHADKAKTILESTDVDVNGVNSDGLSPLDVAVLSNNKSLIKMLISFGAQEGNEFSSGDNLLSHLRKLSCEAEQRICELAGQDSRNFSLWQRRSKGLSNMILGFTQARPPDTPSLVAVDVTGSHTVNVRYQEPESQDSAACTKYKIEWSTESDFHTLCGYRIVLDPKQQECQIDELTHGQRYYFRVCCGNIRGWGLPRPSTPHSVVPSSWRDIVKKEDRVCNEGIAQLDKLFSEVRTGRPDIKAIQESFVAERRKKTTIKQLFTAASKFQKNLRRGVYLSCLLYNEDKVLLTNEDFLPVIEVDETYPGSIYHDFHWLLKVACTWDDVKWLRQDMEKSLSSPAIHFRIKLLQAAAQMQTALSVQDLGQLYHKPLRDAEGTIVISTVNYVRSPKTVSVLNSRWVPLVKLTKRAYNMATDATLSDILMGSISDQITYHQVSSIRLPRGLYLGYLKMRSSVDLLQVLVPAKAPNVPPHCKIRDNPHVTAEEWECLTNKCGSSEKLLSENEQQRTFVEQVAATANRLLTYMQVSDEQSQNHRLYDAEVVEVSNDVSLLIVVPPPESACSAPGQGEVLLQRPDLIPLPVQVFEMVHLGTYHKQLVARYSRLSCIIELDTALAQHSHREAFSSCEVSAAKERLSRLEALQTQLNSAWKQARWLLDVLTFARDKVSQTPTNIMRHLLALHPRRSRESISSHNGLLLPPEAKGVKSRGSWPGPGVTRLLGAATTELSRSEHHLSTAGSSTPPLTSRPPPPAPQQNKPVSPPAVLLEQPRLPPSKSEDTLAVHTRVMPSSSHSRTRSSASASTSPLLSIRQGYGSGSLYSLSSDDSGVVGKSKSEGEEGATVPAPSPGILQVKFLNYFP